MRSNGVGKLGTFGSKSIALSTQYVSLYRDIILKQDGLESAERTELLVQL